MHQFVFAMKCIPHLTPLLYIKMGIFGVVIFLVCSKQTKIVDACQLPRQF